MKLKLQMYVAQPRKGHWEVSIPWIAQLAEPVRGPSPAQLKEEMVFRVLELVHTELRHAELDRVLPLNGPYLTSIYLDVHRRVDADRPEVQMNTTTHVIVGTWQDDPVLRLWVPKAPGVCIALKRPDDMYAALSAWARDWADANAAEDLERLACVYTASLETIEIDLGWPRWDEAEPAASGRLMRPEALLDVATNLSHRAQDGSLGRAFGRDAIVDELVEAIMSRRPQNVCLVGPPGVGKTALVHEAARRACKLAAAYQERRDIWQTSGDRIIAGMSIIGQWEQRTEAICRELAERGDVLFAEDLLGLVRAGRTYHGDSNVARFIEPYLEQDQFSVIAETTEEKWVRARGEAPGFVDRFRRIQVPELSYRDTLGVTTALIREIEAERRVRFTADSVEALLQLARRFFRQEAFPGKAVRLVRQCQYAAERVAVEDDASVRLTPELVAEVVQRSTGLPPTILRPGSGRSYDEVLATFSARVFGQNRAMDVVSRLVVTIEQGLTDPARPLAALLLVGPSGVGKTETAKALAADLFGSEDRVVRFDMSELSGPAALTRLIGTPQQPDGELTSRVRLQPFCVLLFDEVEKAHPLVLDLLLQLLGDGRLTDASGRTADFRNAIVVMTSNLGASSEDRWLGFQDAARDRALHYRRAAEEFFRPELFNRIDHVVAYSPLGPEALRRIARRTLQNLLQRRGLQQAQVMVDVDEGLLDYLVKHSIDPRYGARTLANRIEQTLVAPLAAELTAWTPGASLTRVALTPSDDGIAIDLQAIELAPATAKPIATTAPASDRAAIIAELAEITRATTRLAEDPRRNTLVVEYDRILREINELDSSSPQYRAMADDLRRHESVLNRFDKLERRVAGLQDARGTGEFIFALPTDDRAKKAHAHRWARIAKEIRNDVRWAQCQIDDLATGGSVGATIIVTGVSGPYAGLVARWARWLRGLDEALEMEALWAENRDGKWWPTDTLTADATGFAMSALAPGAHPLLQSFQGYCWSPRPPSHGQHALVAIRVIDHAAPQADRLVELLAEPRNEQGLPVEFVEREGQIEDLRTTISHPIPEERGNSRFAVALAFSRLTAVSEGANDG